jgi:tetratricopeptide (TPR) repeat protein
MTALVPDELSALLALMELHWSEGCGPELAGVCRRLADAGDDPLVTVGALRELAGLAMERDGVTAAAKEIWAEVLSLRPGDVAARQALGADVGASAAEVLRPELAAASELVHALARVGDTAGAAKALETVAELYGPSRDWPGLGEAYAAILERLEPLGDDGAAVRLLVQAAGARLDAEHVASAPAAEERLRAVLSAAPDDVETRVALAELLARDEGRREAAIEEHQRVLLVAACRVESVRALELLWREGGQADRAHLALGVASALRVTSPEEEDQYQRGRRSWAGDEDRALPRDLLELHTLTALDEAPPAEAVALLRGLEPYLPAIYPPDLGAYGLAREDRIPPPERHPLRQRGEPLSYLLGVPSFDVYLHSVPARGVGLEPTDPPSLIFPAACASWPAAEQTFVLGALLGELALGSWLARKLTAFELHRLLVATTRIFYDGYAREMAKPDAIDNLRRKLERTLPQAAQDRLAPLAKAYAGRVGPPVDTGAWIRQMQRVGRRVGLLACGDLDAALAVVARFDEDLAKLPLETAAQRCAAFERSVAVRDLVGWFVSDEHFTLRRLAGFEGAP